MLLGASAARSVGEITAQLQLSQHAVSHHLKILRDARLLTVEPRGTRRRYALNTAEYAELLAPMRELVNLITACTSSPND